MDVIEDLVNDLKTIKNYHDEVAKERKEKESREQKEASSLRDLSNLYLAAHKAQEDDWRLQNKENQTKALSLEKTNRQMEEKILHLEAILQRRKEESKEADNKQKELRTKMDQMKLEHQAQVTSLKSDLREATSCKNEYSREIESLKSEKEKVSSRLKDGSQRHRHESGKLKNDLQEAKLQVTSLEKRIKIIEGRERSAAEELEVKHKLTSELTTQILIIEERSSQFSAANRDLEDKLAKQEKQWQKELKKAEDERNSLMAEKKKWEEKLRRKERSMQERLEDVESSNSQLAIEKRKIEREAGQKRVELQTLMENVEAELVRANTKIESSEEMMFSQEKHYKKQLEDLESRRSKIQTENDKLRSDVKTAREEADKKVKHAEAEKQKISTELKKLKLDMKETNKEAEITIKRLESDVANQKAEHVQLVQSCDARQPIIEDQSQRLQEQKVTMGMLQERIKVLDHQLSETIAGKHDQLYKERKQMKEDEEEKFAEILQEKVAMETRIHQLEMELSELQHKNESLDKRVAQQSETLQKNQESSVNQNSDLKRNLQEKTEQHRKLLLVNCELEERVTSLEKTAGDLDTKLKKRDFEIKGVMVKNMDLRTDLKHAKNKTNNEVVLLRAELRENKHRLRETEEELGVVKYSEETLRTRVTGEGENRVENEEKLLSEIKRLQEKNRHLKDIVEEGRSDHEDEQKRLNSDLEEAQRRMESALYEMEGLERELRESNRRWEEEGGVKEQKHKREINELTEKNAVLHGRLATQASQNTTKLAAMEQSLYIAQNEIADLQRSKESLEEELRTYTMSGRDQADILQNENSILQAKMEEIEKENACTVIELEEILEQTRGAREGLEAEMGGLKDSRDKLTEEVTRLQGELNKRQRNYLREVTAIQSEKKALQSAMKTSRGRSFSEAATARLEVDTLQRQGSNQADEARTRAELEQVKQQLGAVKQTNERYEEEIDNLKQEIEDRNIRLEINATTATEDANWQMKQLKLDLERMKQTNESLDGVKRANQKYEQELEAMKNEMEGVKQTNQRLEKVEFINGKHQEEMETMMREMESVRRTNKELELVKCSNQRKEQELEELRQELEKVRQNNEKLGEAKWTDERYEEEVGWLKEELEKAKRTNERYVQEMGALETENERVRRASLRSERGSRTDRDQEQEVRQLKVELARLKRTNERQEQDLRELELAHERTKRASQSLEPGRYDRSERDQELARAEEELDRLRKELREVMERSERDGHASDQGQREMKGRESELFQANEANCTLETEVERLKTAETHLKGRLVELEEERDQALVRMEEDVAKYKEENRGLRDTCKNLQGQNSDSAVLRSELETLKQREKGKTAALAELAQDEQKLREELEDMAEKLADETDQWQQKLSELENKNLKLQKSVKEGDALGEQLRKVKGQLDSLKRNYSSLEDKETSTMRRLRASERDLDKERDSHGIEIRKFTMEVAKLKNEVHSLTSENKSLASERSAIQARASDFTSSASKEKEAVQTRAQVLEQDLQQTKETANDQEKTISHLESMCTMLEEQVTDLEKLSERLELNLQESVSKNESLEEQLSSEKEDQRKLAEGLRADLDQMGGRVRELEKREADMKEIRDKERKAFEEVDREHREEVEDLNRDSDHWRKQGENYKEQALQLARQLGNMQTSCATMENDLRSLKEKIAAEQKDSDHLTNELTGIVGKFEHTKATNFKLTSCLEKAIETGKELEGVKDNLESEVTSLQSNYSVEKVKLRGMMSQQAKLIDFLQAKMEEPPKKKKKKLFGKSGKDKTESVMIPLPYKELQDLLEYEQCKNAGLERCLEETRKELQMVKMSTLRSQSAYSTSHLSLNSDVSMTSAQSDTSTVLSAIVLSPGNQPSPDSLSAARAAGPSTRGKRRKVAQNPTTSKRVKERMKHNIPHRFTTSLNMKPTICAGCIGTVHFGRHAAKCQECHRICHPKCASALPHTCGLPFQFVQHFSESLHHQADSPVSALDSSTESAAIAKAQGWMKVKSSEKQGWEKKWLVLDCTQLLMFNRENVKATTRPWKTFDLQPEGRRAIVHAGVTLAELPNTVASDLPFVIKLDHGSQFKSCFPSAEGALYLMAPTFQDKQRWLGALESVVIAGRVGSSASKEAHTASVSSNLLLSLERENKLDINCTMILGELLFLGCDEGLYVMSLERLKGPLAQLLRVGAIYQMKHVQQLGIVIIIAGELRKLGFIDVSHLTTQAQKATKQDTPVRCTSIATLDSCHLFAVEEIDKDMYLCAAQAGRISVMKHENNKFVLKKEIPTSEPCSCLIFSQTGLLIAGMDRFYKVDLKTFLADEFLDSSDGSLAKAISSGVDMDSFPVAALLISSHGEVEEFLLCYHEFAVFVNAKGTRSRPSDLLWSRLPLSVSYREPYLYITHFNCLEVLEIKPLTQIDRPQAHATMELANPRFTGFAKTEGAVYVTSIQSQKVELICLKGNLADISPDDQDATIVDSMDDTPRSSVSSMARGDSRISLKRTLDEDSETSTSKLSRTSTQSSHHDSFRAAISASNPIERRSQPFPSASSSEEESSCGSVKMFSRGQKGGHHAKH